jgi:hypothetical protein
MTAFFIYDPNFTLTFLQGENVLNETRTIHISL